MRKTTSELSVLGERHGWKARPLTPADIRAMSATEIEWNEVFNKANLHAALNTPTPAEKARQEEVKAVRSLAWHIRAERVDDEEQLQIEVETVRLRHRYPALIDSEENWRILGNFLGEHRLLPTLQNFERAYLELVPQGLLSIDPSAIGVGTETNVSGNQLKYLLRNRKGFEDILEPMARPEQTAQYDEAMRMARQSAADYRKEHGADTYFDPEYPTRVSPLITARGNKTPIPEVRAEGQVTRLSDQSGHAPGYPEYFSEEGKASFRRLVSKMSASELADRCRTDPQFRRAVDKMNQE